MSQEQRVVRNNQLLDPHQLTSFYSQFLKLQKLIGIMLHRDAPRPGPDTALGNLLAKLDQSNGARLQEKSAKYGFDFKAGKPQPESLIKWVQSGLPLGSKIQIEPADTVPVTFQLDADNKRRNDVGVQQHGAVLPRLPFTVGKSESWPKRRSQSPAYENKPLLNLHVKESLNSGALEVSPVVTKVTADNQVTVLRTPKTTKSKQCGKIFAFQFNVIQTPVPTQTLQDLLPLLPSAPARTESNFGSLAGRFECEQPPYASAYTGAAGRRQGKLDDKMLRSPNPIKRLMKGFESPCGIQPYSKASMGSASAGPSPIIKGMSSISLKRSKTMILQDVGEIEFSSAQRKITFAGANLNSNLDALAFPSASQHQEK